VKRRSKAMLLLGAGIIVVCLVASGMLSNNIVQRENAGVSAKDAPSIPADLAQVLAKAGPNDLIKVWVELDEEEYEKATGNSFWVVQNQYANAREKTRRAAYNELSPEEIIAIIHYEGIGVEPPVELANLHHYLYWYVKELTPSMIYSTANFSGLQRMTLYERAEDAEHDSFLVSYVKKVAEEYPAYRIGLSIGIAEQFDPKTDALNYSYELIRGVLQRYGAQKVQVFPDLHSMYVEAPSNLSLIAELSKLPEVQWLEPNRVYTIFDP
jgi:hypothetical protein